MQIGEKTVLTTFVAVPPPLLKQAPFPSSSLSARSDQSRPPKHAIISSFALFLNLRVELRFRPLSTGSRKIHVHLVDVDSMEIVGAWLATATAMPPVVTKSYEVDLPLGRACHKRIAYSNPWNSTRLFRLASSDPKIVRPRYESLEVNHTTQSVSCPRL